MADPQTRPSDDPLDGLRAAPDPRDPRAPSLLHGWDGEAPLGERRVLLGLPYDGGIPSRPGARFGPAAARRALDAYTAWSGQRQPEPLLDLGDVALPSMNGREAHRRIESAAERVFRTGARPLFLGGDHGCTGSVLRGLAAARPGLRLAVISLDAHLDVREYAGEAELSSGTPFRRALETSVLSGERLGMIGIRRFANSEHYLRWAHERGIALATVEEVEAEGAERVAARVRDRVMRDADALYLSVDLDAVDAAFAPGVSAAAVGGLTAREMITLVRTLAAEPRLVGADIMELSPPYDADRRTAKLAARLLLEIAHGG